MSVYFVFFIQFLIFFFFSGSLLLFLVNKKKLSGAFVWMEFKRLKATTEPLQGDSVLFTTKSAGNPGTRILSTLEGWKAESTLEPPIGFELGTPVLRI